MQTFLPYSSFSHSAYVLDTQRLGKQRVETLQILNALLKDGGWQNHPAVNMWRGYEGALIRYGVAICLEWRSRGHQDTCLMKISMNFPTEYGPRNPPWLGSRRLHQSHRSNLLRKNPEHYGQFFEEPDDIPYYWPKEST